MILSRDVSCVILASGASSRFGGSKMLYEFDRGVSILAKTIAIYRAVFDQVHVVIKHNDRLLTQLVEDQGAICIENTNSQQGLSQSIISGIKYTSPDTAWLVALGDMPYVSVTTVASLVQRASASEIVVPRTTHGNGNPIVFGVNFNHQLLDLTGDVGAKLLLKRYAQQVNYYDCDDQGIHHDIDRISDIR